jgi:hypothetical protein
MPLTPTFSAFASEINALREVPDINLQVNRQAMYDLPPLRLFPLQRLSIPA